MPQPEFNVEFLDPKTLAPHPLNFRRHPEAQKEALASSLSEHGYLSAPIWNKRSGNLLDGHARVELAVAGGLERVPVRVIDVPEEQERRILRTFDRIGALAEEDEGALSALIEQIGDTDLERLLGDLETTGEIGATPPEEFPEVDESLPTEHCCPRCQYTWSGKSG